MYIYIYKLSHSQIFIAFMERDVPDLSTLYVHNSDPMDKKNLRRKQFCLLGQFFFFFLEKELGISSFHVACSHIRFKF